MLLLIFLSLAKTGITGDKKLRLYKLHYENTSGEKAITTFEYDENGIMHKAKWALLDGSRYSINYHTFDKNGNMIQKYREFSDKVTSNLIYKFDEKGNLINEFFKRSDGVKGTVVYKYDSTGKLLKAECKGLNGWFHGTLLYKYNSNQVKICAIILQKENNVGTITYEYNEKNMLIREHWDFSGKWKQTFIYEYVK
jgi:hypothetical protein